MRGYLQSAYYTQGAEGATTGIVINYVEWGEGVV